MQFTLFSANCTGNAANCRYPNERRIQSPQQLQEAVRTDHVCAAYKDHYRSCETFLQSDVLPMDIDNDHTENPAEYITPERLEALFPDVNYCLVPSRHHNLPKGSRSAAPRYHMFFPVEPCRDAEAYVVLKAQLQKRYPFFDGNALDAARFLFGSPVTEVIWHDGSVNITDLLESRAEPPEEPSGRSDPAAPTRESILEGSRNNTMSHFAGRVLKKLGICEEAKQAFRERSEKCEPPLPGDELERIWNSAVKFYSRISSGDGYVSPEIYNGGVKAGCLKPEDYSDLGEAKVLSKYCDLSLRYTSATDYITFHEDRWYEDRQKSLGTVEDFLDTQLRDAERAIREAENALIALGIDAREVRSRDRSLERKVPPKDLKLLHTLLSADIYKKFAMKYRNYKNIVNAQNAAKPMLAIDVSELDYDPELLNTPAATYDLTQGLRGGRAHDPDDLITKITACSPGAKGKALWEDALRLFFCNDPELIDYVQGIVGMTAVGKVYAEHLIIAYGGGANGKSTFWNTLARVLGNYSGKISSEALTSNCKRNVKPEMAELKGKRLVIASELEEGTRLNTGMVKELCSIDPIEAEKKYKDPFHFEPSHTLVLYTNYLPKVSTNDDGTWRRLIVIPFNAKITGKSDIKNYSDYLFDNAGPAILSWIIEGAEKAIRKGFKFTLPEAVREAIDAYREDNDWLGQFVEEHCDVDSSFSEKSGELYQSYRAACILNGEYIRSTTDFYGALEKAGFGKRKTRIGRVIVGLRLKEGQDFLQM